MAVSIETYMLINLVMNLSIIGIVARSRGRVVWWRVFFASAFGSVYAVAMKSGWFPQLNYLWAKLFLAVITTFVAVSFDGAWSLISGTMTLLGCTVFIGGVVSMMVRLFGRSALTLSIGAIVGLMALVAALALRERKLDRWEAQVSISYAGKKVGLNAMIDTGNRLREPLSGLPVLITEYRAIKHMLPQSLDPAMPCQSLPDGFRLAGYQSIGSNGQIALFRPDELFVSYGDGWLKAQDIWVGVFAGTIPGQYRAIAPPVIGRIKQTTGAKRDFKYIEGSDKSWVAHTRRLRKL